MISGRYICYDKNLLISEYSVANNKSAKKRIQIAERNRLINKSYKSTVRTLTKKTLENCEKYKKDAIQELKRISMRTNSDSNNKINAIVEEILQEVKNYGDKAVKKNVLHKNNGANKKSKINSLVKTTLTAK